jgi:hypothetical protein
MKMISALAYAINNNKVPGQLAKAGLHIRQLSRNYIRFGNESLEYTVAETVVGFSDLLVSVVGFAKLFLVVNSDNTLCFSPELAVLMRVPVLTY